MRSIVKTVARWLGVSTARRSKQRVVPRAIAIESLEGREVLSATPTALLAPASTGPTTDVAPLAAAASTGYITAVYQNLLNRVPDPSGLSFYTKVLNSGAAPSAVANSIWASAEHRGIEVDGFYQTFFHRAADPLGRQSWVNLMLKGATEETVTFDFLISPEYQKLNPLTQPFVTALYNNVLGRAPDAAGSATFVGALQTHTATPSTVIQSFVSSHELHMHIVDSYYTNYLQRPADPVGEAGWVQQLDQATATVQVVGVAFLSSQEYINLHPFF